jgi:DNA processing protein
MHHAVRIRDILHLKSIPKISDRKIISLVNYFERSADLVTLDPRALVKAPGIRESDASLIRHSRIDERSIDEQFSLVNRVNGSIISYWDKNYPLHLKNIYDPPALLFVRGALRTEDNYSIAIVGTRHPTNTAGTMPNTSRRIFPCEALPSSADSHAESIRSFIRRP